MHATSRRGTWRRSSRWRAARRAVRPGDDARRGGGAGKHVLDADRGSVWLYDARRRRARARGGDEHPAVRVPAGSGLVGACARERADHQRAGLLRRSAIRSRASTRRSGYRTRCMLTLPLVDHKGVLVGVMQVLNKARRRVRCRRRELGRGARRAMRGGAAARADDRGADRGREDAPGSWRWRASCR